ncbi:TnsD family Tn7-like transposition protein [Vibrio sp. VB16]|uniref:TnsD family Tn7-like transposition protein n=1 Tax=Vibrio sp. VB16 TaxID=2785746 RepID=UPI00189F6DD3|nr:TnsD family Tn7-like transposition protein [Vibrio sp. VB16]UGA56947.1 TnsD family transposase [Vibrio sp. VB16]
MFLKWIEGESVFGLVARHHATCPYHSLREKNRVLLHRPDIKISPQLPCSLNTISCKTGFLANELLFRGTTYPLVSATIRNVKGKKDLRLAMLSDCGTSVMALSRLVSSRLNFGNTIKYCPRCLESDKIKYGYGVWYTNHQISGVTVCPKHLTWLINISLDGNGLNKRIEPPPTSIVGFRSSEEPPSSAAIKLSQFLSDFFALTQGNDNINLSEAHLAWLGEKGYLTPDKHIRLSKLSYDFNHYWTDIFETELLPKELSNISYVRNLIKPDTNLHYVKHALLGAFFVNSPIEYFSRYPLGSTQPSLALHSKEQQLESDTKAITLLQQGHSLRSVAEATGKSVGYVTKVASQHDIKIKHRYKQLTDEIAFKIVRLAYRGIHRKDIAKECGVGIGSIEQKIEGQEGLSEWRRKLRYFEARAKHRLSLLNYKNSNPDCSRNELRNKTTDYLWLFKHDKNWLTHHLPNKMKPKFYGAKDWDSIDEALVKRIHMEITQANSLSDIDRQLIGAPSIRANKERLPLAYVAALKIISKT